MLEGKVVVITRNRCSLKQQILFQSIPESLYPFVTYITNESDERELRKIFPKEIEIVSFSDENLRKGVSFTRQFAVDWGISQGLKKIILLDDNFKFNTTKENKKILTSTHDEIIDALKEIEKGLDSYAHFGFKCRNELFFSLENHNKEDIIDFTKLIVVHGLNLEKIKESGVRWDYLQQKYNDDRLSILEDYCFILQLLEKGYKSGVSLKYGWSKATFSKGGCNSYRTSELSTLCLDKLIESFPRYVSKVNAKKTEFQEFTPKINWKLLKKDFQDRENFLDF